MKKNVVITLMVCIAFLGAAASKNSMLNDFLYYPNGPGTDPVPISTDKYCPNFQGECLAIIQGVTYQVYRVNPASGLIEPCKP